MTARGSVQTTVEPVGELSTVSASIVREPAGCDSDPTAGRPGSQP